MWNEHELEARFEQWGRESSVVTDFSKSSPLPISGHCIYNREASIAWQAFRYAYGLAQFDAREALRQAGVKP